MSVAEAMEAAAMQETLYGHRTPSAKHWHRLSQEVRDTLAKATSDEIGKVVLFRPEIAPTRSHRSSVFCFRTEKQ